MGCCSHGNVLLGSSCRVSMTDGPKHCSPRARLRLHRHHISRECLLTLWLKDSLSSAWPPGRASLGTELPFGTSHPCLLTSLSLLPSGQTSLSPFLQLISFMSKPVLAAAFRDNLNYTLTCSQNILRFAAFCHSTEAGEELSFKEIRGLA